MKKIIVIISALIALLSAVGIIGVLIWLATIDQFPPVVTVFKALAVGLPVILISLLVLFDIKLTKTGRILGAILAVIIGLLATGGIVDEALFLCRYPGLLILFVIGSLVSVAAIVTMLAYVIQALRATGRTPADLLAKYQVTILVSFGLLCAMIGAWGAIWFLDNQTITDRTVAESHISELVLRHQFEHNASGMQTRARAYCIEISDEDPSDKFLDRFKDHQPPVKKGSEFIFGQDIKFSVSDFKWINGRTVEVCGGCYEAPLSGSGYTYRIIRKTGRWIIEKTFDHWIS